MYLGLERKPATFDSMPHDHGNPRLMYLGFKQGTCNFLFHATRLWKSYVFRLQTGNCTFCLHGNPYISRLETETCNLCFHTTWLSETLLYLGLKTETCNLLLPATCLLDLVPPPRIFRLEKGNLQFCRLEKENLLPCHTTVRNPHLMLLGLKTGNL